MRGTTHKLRTTVAAATLLAGCAAADRPRSVEPSEGTLGPQAGAAFAGLAVVAGAGYPPRVFREFGVNPTVETAARPSTVIALEADTASWSIAREALRAGRLPEPASVRVEDFVQAVTPVDAQAAPASLTADSVESPDRPGYALMRIVFRPGGDVGAPASPVAVVDAGARTTAVLDLVGVPGPVVRADADAGGGGGLRQALERAWALGHEAVVVSDGTSPSLTAEDLLAAVSAAPRQGRSVSVIGVGGGALDDAALHHLAWIGRGTYGFVAGPEDVAWLRRPPFAAVDVRVALHLDPEVVSRYRVVGLERELAGRGAGTLEPAGGAVPAGGAAVLMVEIAHQGTGGSELGRVVARWTDAAGRPQEQSLSLEGADQWLGWSPEGEVARVAAALAEKLRASWWARRLQWARLSKALQSLPKEVETRPEVRELAWMVERAAELDRRADRFEARWPVASMGFDHVPVVQ